VSGSENIQRRLLRKDQFLAMSVMKMMAVGFAVPIVEALSAMVLADFYLTARARS